MDYKDMKVNTNMDIKNISLSENHNLKTDDELMAVSFSYNIDYQEKIAKIHLEGALALSIEKKKADEVMKEWEKKNVAEDFRLTLFNLILRKSSLKAMELEEDLNLPFHLPFPSLGKPKETDSENL